MKNQILIAVDLSESSDLVIKKGTGCYYCGAGAEDSI
jgi:hypothetical protein